VYAKEIFRVTGYQLSEIREPLRTLLQLPARKRMNMRKISEKDVLRVLRHGLIDDTKEDRVVRYIPESPFYQTQSQKLEELRGCRVIVSRDGVIVTVMWKEDDV
jgi:hypothetical protein